MRVDGIVCDSVQYLAEIEFRGEAVEFGRASECVDWSAPEFGKRDGFPGGTKIPPTKVEVVRPKPNTQ